MSLQRLAWVAILLLGPALAGCLRDPETRLTAVEGADPSPTEGYVEQTQAPAPEEANLTTTGAIQGVVVNDNNASLENVHVSLLGTNSFTKTDDQGRFAFVDIAPATYRLRADKDAYESVEEAVSVTAKSITFVRVVLIAPGTLGGGFREHFHDFWDGQDRYEFLRGQYMWPPDAVTSGGAKGSTACLPRQSGQASRGSGCEEMPIPIKEKIVPPGASQMEVTINWKQQDYVKQVEFHYTTANFTNPFPGLADFRFALDHKVVIPRGETRVVALEPVDADNGHARYTSWTFKIKAEFTLGGAIVFNHPELMNREVAPFDVKVDFLKGDLFADPPHRRFWTNGSKLVLADQVVQEVTALQNQRDPTTFNGCMKGNVCFALPGDLLVPPGATKLEVTLKYSSSTTAVDPYISKKTLAFRTAAVNPNTAQLSDLRVETPKTNPIGTTTYVLSLTDAETDSFYQKHSSWSFLLANAGKERDPEFTNECSTGCGKGIFLLSVVAINENWDADFKAGRI
ncbi:MAG: carboxypeptidase regulatory-like domain-containing protein [Euryarchaeota archaeon]|nr:carboxypeptidase regulatory-like domain-containing protein [Euryarchaeota archaeon]